MMASLNRADYSTLLNITGSSNFSAPTAVEIKGCKKQLVEKVDAHI